MIVSADKEMRFYASYNLKDWTYLSAGGEGYGVQPRQFECPDMVQLPVNGNKGYMKWVMIVNVNLVCYFGGQCYAIFCGGNFDGMKFVCDSPKETVKWLDWEERTIIQQFVFQILVIGVHPQYFLMWSNWQYANIVPTKQFHSANTLPRELGLYEQDGEFMYQ